MNQLRKCSKCQKEIATGKFYNFFTLNTNKNLSPYQDTIQGGFWCPLCADKEKKEDTIYGEKLLKLEWEIGKKTDEQIIEFERLWREHEDKKNQFKKRGKNLNLISNWCQEAKKELTPYLQKTEIVKNSFGRKVKNEPLTSKNFVYYLFDKSAREKNYRKEVVEPTIARILGVEKLNQEINTTTAYTNDPDNYFTGGKLKFDSWFEVDYCWVDDREDCRRIRLNIGETKLALQSLCRALSMKEKELKNKPENKNSPLPPQKENLPTSPNRILIISLVVMGIIILVGWVTIIFWKRKNSERN
ncbi:MAG: hypothetical protein I3273_01420 [Candidatus Moeniiplasma glomeromycotorum]|nr:hypothetical protein [Candidatus Moeniiplasma glomeromycotorum]MCE8167218.1 hypothetical protein [Candidatus Moeniiplasma glomeromycotorum]MCE8168769.1 hypothetical protein [Candidatus Moeniiplasma glomeromycotorum]